MQDCFPALRPEWVLRNDEHKVILYLMSDHQIEYTILDPASAVVASLFNGQRSELDLVEMVRYIFDLSQDLEARRLLDRTISSLNERFERVAVLDRPSTWAKDYDTMKFLVSPEDFANEHRLTKPLSLMIFFTGRCQTACVYCYADTANMRKRKELTVEEWTPILEDARNLDIRMIQLTGGDPMARPDSADFLSKLAETGFLFMVSTKCFIDKKSAEKIAGSGFNDPVCGVRREFQVSIDSSDPEVADSMVGRSGYLKKATETVKSLLDVGINPKVKAVVTPLNYGLVRSLVEMFSDLGIEKFQFSNYSRSHYRHDDVLFLTDEMRFKAAKLLGSISQERPDLRIEGDSVNFRPSEKEGEGFREKLWEVRAGCSAGRTNLGIAPDGQAVLCEQMPMKEPYLVGDLTRQSIVEVWNSPELLKFIHPPRERFSGTECFSCEDFESCVWDTGYCFRDALFAYGNLHHPPPNCPKVPEGAYRTA